VSPARAAVAGLLLGALALAGAAAAQEAAEALQPCRRADVLGLWEVVRLGLPRGSPVDRTDPAYHPFQRYVFHANATMLHVTSLKQFTAAQQRALLTAPAPTTWAIDVDGRLLLQRQGATRLEASACRVLVKEVTDPRSSAPAYPGDLLLTDYDENDRPAARRLLRRLRAPDPPRP
jgi:hypothetical protein